MKISPVAGTPTIQNPSPTGLAPEKLARLKAIAAGTDPVAEEIEEKEKKALQPTQRQSTIKMTTNRTIHRDLPITTDMVQDAAPTTSAVAEPENAISDTGVQTNGVPEATEPLSPQLAAIAKQRRALQVKERELADKLKAAERAVELEARIKTQPLSVLQELGVTYDQLTNDILAAQNGTNPEIQKLTAKIEALEQGLDKKLSDKDAAAEKAVLTEIRRNVNSLCESEKDFGIVQKTNSQADVVELIHRTYKETGEILDEREATRLVSLELKKELQELAPFISVQPEVTSQAPLQQQPAPAMRTLTNKDQAKPVMGRRERAMAAMLGHLKR